MNTESRLREIEGSIQRLLDQSPIIFTVFDREGVIIMNLGHGLEVIGRTQNENIGQSIFDIYKNVPQALQHMRNVFAGNDVHETGHVRGAPLESWIRPVKDDAGSVIGAVAVAFNAADRTAIEAGLNAADRRIEDLVEKLIAEGAALVKHIESK